MKFIKTFAAFAAAGAVSMSASAGVTTVGFVGAGAVAAQGPLGLITTNYTEAGYRFSPKCHLDFRTQPQAGPLFADNAAIGWDVSGCEQYFNSNYLGQPGSTDVYVDHGGALFDLVSLIGMTQDFSGGSGSVRSSKGGYAWISVPGEGLINQAFVGDEWKDVEWIAFGAYGGIPPWFLDSVTFNAVPEPATLALLGIAAFAARRVSRRRESAAA
jgi:hypothetical protein